MDNLITVVTRFQLPCWRYRRSDSRCVWRGRTKIPQHARFSPETIPAFEGLPDRWRSLFVV